MTETTHRGVRWRRDEQGRVSFFDSDAGKWVDWVPGVDAPPLPPKWQLLGVPTRVTRPGWRSPWRLVPVVLVAAAVAIAIWQASVPSTNNSAKETQESAALLGKCLPKAGHGFSSKPVSCDSPKAAAKVVAVVPSDPPTPCPSDANGVARMGLAGVAHPHVLCIMVLRPLG